MNTFGVGRRAQCKFQPRLTASHVSENARLGNMTLPPKGKVPNVQYMQVPGVTMKRTLLAWREVKEQLSLITLFFMEAGPQTPRSRCARK
jgi:hypothetical protein